MAHLLANGDPSARESTSRPVESPRPSYARFPKIAQSPWVSAFDYDLEFSATGEGEASWKPGIQVKDFDDGWTTLSEADDYVIRWKAPDGMDARYVRAFAQTTSQRDRNVQIDAIIAANVVEDVKIMKIEKTQSGGIGGSGTEAPVEVKVTYEVIAPDGQVEPFKIAVYASNDGRTPTGDPIAEVVIEDHPQNGCPDGVSDDCQDDGEHTWTFEIDSWNMPANGMLIAVVDVDDDILESHEADNSSALRLGNASIGFQMSSDLLSNSLGLAEPGGVAASTQTPPSGSADVLWTINRGAGGPYVYAIDSSGTVIKRFTMQEQATYPDIAPFDLQDIAIGPSSTNGHDVYVADIGAGSGRSENQIDIYRFPEPTGSALNSPNTATINNVLRMAYCFTPSSLDPCDEEDTPPNGQVVLLESDGDDVEGIYVITDGQNNKSQVWHGLPDTWPFVSPLEYIGEFEFEGFVVAAAMTGPHDGERKVLLKTATKAYVVYLDTGDSLRDLDDRPYYEIPYDSDEGGIGIGFDASGEGYFTINETTGEIYRHELPPDIGTARFYGDGDELRLDYEVPAGVTPWPFHIAVYRTTDGIHYDLADRIGSTHVDDAEAGANTASIDVNLADLAESDKLVAVIGATIFPLEGGVFSSDNRIFIVGTDAGDVVELSQDGSDLAITFNGELDEYDSLPTETELWILGSDGNDLITAIDVEVPLLIYGGDGHDVLYGSAGDNLLYGDDGDDDLIAGPGSLLMYGDAGNDRYVFAATGHQARTVLISEGTSAEDIDTLDFSQLDEPVDVNLSLTGTADRDVSESLTLNANLSLFENVVGSNLPDEGDTFRGNVANNVFDGGDGPDTYLFIRTGSESLGHDTIDDFGIDGADTLDFGDFTTTTGIVLDLTSTAEQHLGGNETTAPLHLTIASEFAVENVIGTSASDQITGNELNNVFTGNGGDDTLTGAAGDDTYRYVDGPLLGSDVITEAGVQDSDTLDFSEYASWIYVNLLLTEPQIVSTDYSGPIELTLTLSDYAGIENVIGTEFDDEIRANGRANRLEGGPGTDILWGERGDDTYVYRWSGTGDVPGLDGIVELDQYDYDTLDFSGLLDVELDIDLSLLDYALGYQPVAWSDPAHANEVVGLYLANGDFTLISGTTIENVIGTPGDDEIVGNDHNNRLEGRGGNDHLMGTEGEDTYVFARLDEDTVDLGSDTVVDYEAEDVLDFTDYEEGISVDLTVFNVSQDVTRTGPNHLELTLLGYTSGSTIRAVYGTAADDEIIGGINDNALFGGAGNDTLDGGQGDDLLDGGIGSDVYRYANPSAGYLQDDQIFEAEWLLEDGLDDVDTLDFAGVSSSVNIDIASTVNQSVNNSIHLTLARATDIENVIGGHAPDLIFGNRRNNVLVGNAGGDSIYGYDGDDTLEGGTGSDALAGGIGDDSFIFSRSGSEDLGDDAVSDTAGVDSIDFSGLGTAITAHLDYTTILDVSNVVSVLQSSQVIEQITGTTGADTLYGSSDNNLLIGHEGHDTLYGGAGDDVYSYSRTGSEDLGDDSISDTDGVDTIDFSGLGVSNGITAHLDQTTILDVAGIVSVLQGGGQIDGIVGTAEADTLYGSTAANHLVGGLGDDEIYGGNGEDTLEGGEGDDSLAGGANNDRYIFRRPEGELLGVDKVFEASGEDWLDFTDFDEAVAVDLTLNELDNDTQTVAGGVLDLVLDEGVVLENVVGSSGHDSLRGNSASNKLYGGVGDDTLEGLAGDDILDGGIDDDIYLFGFIEQGTLGADEVIEADHQGADTLDFRNFPEYAISTASWGVNVDLSLMSQQDVDWIAPADYLFLTFSGSYALENVIGSDYGDVITGNLRPNRLEARYGDNTLDAGHGDDTYVYSVSDEGSAYVRDIIVEPNFGGRDTFDFSAIDDLQGVTIDLDNPWNDQSIVNGNQGFLVLNFGEGIENLVGTSGPDTLRGSYETNYLVGGEGGDLIEGGHGQDILDGGAGDDSLYGEDGDDTYQFSDLNFADLGHDRIGETSDDGIGEGGIDTLDFSDAGVAVAVSLYTTNAQVVHEYLDLTLLTIGGPSAGGVENVIGSPFDDRLTGQGDCAILGNLA